MVPSGAGQALEWHSMPDTATEGTTMPVYEPWQPDPTSRHEKRWRRKDGTWGDSVSDAGRTSTDPYTGPDDSPEPAAPADPAAPRVAAPAPAQGAREPLGFWGHAWATAFGIALSIPILIAGAAVALVLLSGLADSDTNDEPASPADVEILDSYWSTDGERAYLVEIGGVETASYCEVHLKHDGRRTGDWGNELWDGQRSKVTVAVYYPQHKSDTFEVECR